MLGAWATGRLIILTTGPTLPKSLLPQRLTRLFAQAEEQEQTDNKAMLRRVVEGQDAHLALGVNDVNAWLKVVERLSSSTFWSKANFSIKKPRSPYGICAASY